MTQIYDISQVQTPDGMLTRVLDAERLLEERDRQLRKNVLQIESLKAENASLKVENTSLKEKLAQAEKAKDWDREIACIKNTRLKSATKMVARYIYQEIFHTYEMAEDGFTKDIVPNSKIEGATGLSNKAVRDEMNFLEEITGIERVEVPGKGYRLKPVKTVAANASYLDKYTTRQTDQGGKPPKKPETRLCPNCGSAHTNVYEDGSCNGCGESWTRQVTQSPTKDELYGDKAYEEVFSPRLTENDFLEIAEQIKNPVKAVPMSAPAPRPPLTYAEKVRARADYPDVECYYCKQKGWPRKMWLPDGDEWRCSNPSCTNTLTWTLDRIKFDAERLWK